MVKLQRLAALTVALALSLGCVSSPPGSRAAPNSDPNGAPSGAPPAQAQGPSRTEPAAPAPGTRLAAPDALSPQATLDLLRSVTAPARNEADLVRRFKSACGAPAAQAVPLTREAQLGETQQFWVLDEPNRRYFQVPATLRHASPHLLFYVQEGASVNADALAASATVFEEKTYPQLVRTFGTLPAEPRLTVFNGRVPGVGGYFSASDLYPRTVNPYSNERVMVFMSLDSTRPGTGAYDAVLAHEAQHFIHWVVKPQQDSWVNEGASELAMAISGYEQHGPARSYLNSPETQLNAWAERPALALPHYGAGYLILEYLAQRMGGYEHLKNFISAPGTSVQTFELLPLQPGRPARRRGALRRPLPRLRGGQPGQRHRPGGRSLRLPAPGGPAGQDAGDPHRLPRHLRWPAAPVRHPLPRAAVPAGCARSGRRWRCASAGPARRPSSVVRRAPAGRAQWWSNAADEMESTLTREVDLSAVEGATLRFSAWYSTERDYDYAGVAVSTDGGCSWQTLPGQHTTDANPVGQNLGHGLTGSSGGGPVAAWVDETMDLSPFAGRKVLLALPLRHRPVLPRLRVRRGRRQHPRDRAGR